MKGPAETRNLGLSVARGEWVCFLDDDDTFSPMFFRDALGQVKFGRDLFYFNYTRVTEADSSGFVTMEEELVHQSQKRADAIYLSNFIPVNTFLAPLQLAKSIAFDLSLQTHEDWDWLIALRANFSVRFVHVPIFGPNVHVSEKSSRSRPPQENSVFALDYLAIYRKWRLPLPALKLARSRLLASRGLRIDSDLL